MRLVINVCFGGFGLSEEAYEKLIEYGVPVQKHFDQERDPETRRYLPQPANEGEVIFDRRLSDDEKYGTILGRYWDSWIGSKRDHPLLLRVVEDLGVEANGRCAKLKIVEIPDGVEWEISEYDGTEHVAEAHRVWS